MTPLSPTDRPSWSQYLPQRDSPYLTDQFSQDFTEFDFVSERREGQGLSVFSLLVNANSKLQTAKERGDYPPGAFTHVANVETAVNAIFFRSP